jgi:hypothetical protein
MLLNDASADRVPRIELGQTNIIFNIPHPSLLLHLHDKSSRNAILLLIQEVKRDLIYKRMNLPPSAQQVTDPRRLAGSPHFHHTQASFIPPIHRVDEIQKSRGHVTAAARVNSSLKCSEWTSMLVLFMA